MGHLRSLMSTINITSVSPSMIPRYLYTSLSYLLLDCPFFGVRQHIAEKIKAIFVEDALMCADNAASMKTKLRECAYTILTSRRTLSPKPCADHFKLLGELIRLDQPQNSSHFPFVSPSAWTIRDYLVRDILRIEWPDQEPVMVPSSTIDASNQTRNAIRRVGLMDCGETSYMNSVLQQLFGIPEIRFAVLCSVECVQKVLDDKEWKSYFVIQELRRVFRCLHNGYTEMHDPIRLVKACENLQTDELGTTRNDASNFYSKIVMVLMEYLLVNTTRTYTNQIACINVRLEKLKTCTKCNKQTMSYGSALHKLGVKVVKKENGELCRSIEDCLEDFIKPVRMLADNGNYCKSCEESTEITVATVCLMSLPEVTLREGTIFFF